MVFQIDQDATRFPEACLLGERGEGFVVYYQEFAQVAGEPLRSCIRTIQSVRFQELLEKAHLAREFFGEVFSKVLVVERCAVDRGFEFGGVRKFVARHDIDGEAFIVSPGVGVFCIGHLHRAFQSSSHVLSQFQPFLL